MTIALYIAGVWLALFVILNKKFWAITLTLGTIASFFAIIASLIGLNVYAAIGFIILTCILGYLSSITD